MNLLDFVLNFLAALFNLLIIVRYGTHRFYKLNVIMLILNGGVAILFFNKMMT